MCSDFSAFNAWLGPPFELWEPRPRVRAGNPGAVGSGTMKFTEELYMAFCVLQNAFFENALELVPEHIETIISVHEKCIDNRAYTFPAHIGGWAFAQARMAGMDSLSPIAKRGDYWPNWRIAVWHSLLWHLILIFRFRNDEIRQCEEDDLYSAHAGNQGCARKVFIDKLIKRINKLVIWWRGNQGQNDTYLTDVCTGRAINDSSGVKSKQKLLGKLECSASDELRLAGRRRTGKGGAADDKQFGNWHVWFLGRIDLLCEGENPLLHSPRIVSWPSSPEVHSVFRWDSIRELRDQVMKVWRETVEISPYSRTDSWNYITEVEVRSFKLIGHRRFCHWPRETNFRWFHFCTEYSAEFKDLAVNRVQVGESIMAVAQKLGLKEKVLRDWVETLGVTKLAGSERQTVTVEQLELQVDDATRR